MICATIPRTSAASLAKLLGVSRNRITTWHRRGVLSGSRATADRRQVLFRLDEVRRAIDEHDLPIQSDAVCMIDDVLSDSQEPRREGRA